MKKSTVLLAIFVFSACVFAYADGSEKEFLSQALKYKSDGRYDEAAAECSKAIALDPKNVKAYTVRADTYFRKGNFDLAIADYGEVIRLNPQSAKAYVVRGGIYFKKGNFDLAIADYNEAIKIDPNDATVFRKRAESYGRKGDYDKSKEDIEKSESLSPKKKRKASEPKKEGSESQLLLDARALDVVLIDKSSGQTFDAGRVPDIGAQLPGHMKAATTECKNMAAEEAKKRKINDWDYYCCTVTDKSDCATKVKELY